MNKRLIILGAGGHGKVIADIALQCGIRDIAFLDDALITEVMEFPVLGKISESGRYRDDRTEFVIAIGNNEIRSRIAENCPLPWAVLIHPSAQIGCQTEIGEGTVVMANAVINTCARVGKHGIINTAAVVEHDNVLADYVHISPRAALGGTVHVGKYSHIGIGASVRNNITIGENCIVGAGAAVVKDITEAGIYAGVPAVKIKDR